MVGGCDVVQLAGQYGTPLYIYDRATLCHSAQIYRSALQSYPASSTLAYASKAYLCVALAQLWHELGLDLDVVGPGELEVALRAGMPPARIHLHGNNKPSGLLRRAVEAGLGRIVLDGWRDFDLLEDLALDPPACVWLRLAPGVDVHTHAYRKTGLVESKFGFPISTGDAALAVERTLHSPALRLMGLHAHIGSQIFEAEPFVACVEMLLGFAAQMRARFGWLIQELCPGGGWGVAYSDRGAVHSDRGAVHSDRGASAVSEYVEAVGAAVIRCCETFRLPLPHLFLEPGRSLVARSGVAVYTVGGRKEVPEQRPYVMLDGGLADNPRPALYGTQYTAVCANRAQGAQESVTLCGPFCESGDILARDVVLPVTVPGDLIAVPVSGAYQLSMASAYNGFPRPAAVMVADGRSYLIQRRETVADLVGRDLALP
jgi:diaminopimelate decarboxylase